MLGLLIDECWRGLIGVVQDGYILVSFIFFIFDLIKHFFSCLLLLEELIDLMSQIYVCINIILAWKW